MNILFITQLLPYPPYTGGKYKTFSILKLLAEKHQVSLVTFYTRRIDQNQIKTLESLLNIKIKAFFHPLVTANSKDIKPIALKSLFSKKTFRVFKYFHSPMARYLNRLTNQIKFDQIHLDHNTSVQYLKFINHSPGTPIVFHEHNINSLAMFRMSLFARRNPIPRLFMLVDALKNYFYEKQIMHQVSRTLAISSIDRQILIKRGAAPQNIQVLPTPFKPRLKFNYPSSPVIIIVGLMSWAPNKLGTLWFGQYVFPIIQQSVPNCRLLIIGANPCQRINKLEETNSSITVVGETESLTPYYQKASLLAAPIPFGSGIRIKILHALSAGLPVISSPIGAEGISPKKQNGILISAYKPQPFAQTVIKVLKNKKLSSQLSRQGLSLIKNYYSDTQARKILNHL